MGLDDLLQLFVLPVQAVRQALDCVLNEVGGQDTLGGRLAGGFGCTVRRA